MSRPFVHTIRDWDISKHAFGSQNPDSLQETIPEEQEREKERFFCDICKQEIRDPRLMPCLHSFCMECLLSLESAADQKPDASRSRNSHPRDYIKMKWTDIIICRGKPSGLSGISNSAFDGEAVEMGTSQKVKRLKCPTCGFDNVLPSGGVVDLPHNYLLQHRIVLATMNKSDVRLLCDLCLHEVVALSRCSKCLLNLCGSCSADHGLRNSSPGHELVSLKEKSGSNITKIRRQAMCPVHPQNDVKFFCLSCNQMTCKKCSMLKHRDHSCGLISKAARMYRRKIKEFLNHTVLVIREAEIAKIQSESIFPELLTNCVTVKKDIDTYINSYIEALEEHRKSLKMQVEQSKSKEIGLLKQQLAEFEKRQKESGYALKFGEDLLAEGSDFEVISLAMPLLRRLDWIAQSGYMKWRTKSKSTKLLQFLRDERAGIIKSHTVFGVLTNQIVSPGHSSLTYEGFNSLRNCRPRQQCQLKLVTRDSNNQPVTHGAEEIDVDLRYDNRRQVPALATDQQDGTYLIVFTPDVPGRMRLSVTIRGHAVKGSPFTVDVKTPLVHKGVFHCCTFCSSGGCKNAYCGCGGRMPGGYRGCGHGHAGHPGKKHWSCCGSVYPNSECSPKPSGFYHLTF